MKWFPVSVISASLVLCLAATVAGTPTPSNSCPGKNVFGISVANHVSNMRGGELLTPSDSEIDSVLSSAAINGNKLVVIDFTASWCGPCRAVAPLYEALSEEIAGVVFLKVDVDENPETAAKFSVSLTFTKCNAGGEVVDRLMGANPVRLRELIEEHK
eukprot:scaffold5157_cov100-Cylindrotheca_fusiformis.AAC.11